MNKLFLLLNSFSKKERKQFEVFLAQAFFNQRKDVCILFKYWYSQEKLFSKEAAFTEVYQNKKYNDRDWYLLTSRLYKLAEQFLTVQEILSDGLLQKKYLIRTFRKKQLPKFFESTFRETKKIIEKQDVRNFEWYHQSFNLELEYYDYVASHNRKERTNLQLVNDQLDHYFIAHKLKMACAAISRKTINQEVYNISLLEELLLYIHKNQALLNNPVLAIYYYCYQAITANKSEEYFLQLRQTMEVHQAHFLSNEKRDVMLMAINYCIRKLNTGNAFYIKEAFELYRLGFADGYLLEGNVLAESTFNNVVALAVKLKEFDWAERFVDLHYKSLKPIFQKPLHFFSMGLLFYHQKKYAQSMKCLVQVDTKAAFLILKTKSLQIKIYYELKEMDALDSLLDNFRVYLQRRKDLGYRKKHYENQLAFTKRLIELPYKSKTSIEKFKSDMEAQEVFNEKDWFLEQLNLISLF